jgi:hypothetical protein
MTSIAVAAESLITLVRQLTSEEVRAIFNAPVTTTVSEFLIEL